MVKYLLFELSIKPIRMTVRKSDLECIEEAKDMLVKNLRYHITISNLATEAGMSESKLKYVFKKVYGSGVFTYLQNARMERARQLLEETDKSVKEIAVITGYKRISSFIRSFRRMFNKSPAAWRRSN
jgi:AraC-like DNA-binding protein